MTWKLSEYLYNLLQPFVRKIIGEISVQDDTDFIRKFQHYYQVDKRLQTTTQFATIKITNLYAIYSIDEMFDLLSFFLKDNFHVDKPADLSIPTIIKLLDLFLRYNFFYYDKQIYRFQYGLPNTMRLTELLSSIFIYLWQKQVFNDPRFKDQFIIQYNDQLFFTWSNSGAELSTYLEQIQLQYQNKFHLHFSHGLCHHFNNMYMENRFGHLYTCVNASRIDQHSKFVLPYAVGHPKEFYHISFRMSLVRAAQFCSNYRDFRRERITLEMTYLLNGYSVDFIESELHKFYHFVHMSKQRFSLSAANYEILRGYTLEYLTVQEKQRTRIEQLKQNKRFISLYYLYDYGSYCQFKEVFSQCWSKLIQNHPILFTENLTIDLHAKHLFSLNTFLTEQKPSCALLKFS